VRLAAILARLLTRDEREAVLGDLVEARVSGRRAALDVMGLVLRQLRGPTIAFLGISVVLGAMLSTQCSGIKRGLDLNLWIWRNYADIDPKILSDTHLQLSHGVPQLFFSGLLLIAWSWTGGFTLASLSGRAAWINGPLFFLAAALVSPHASLVAIALVMAPAIWGMLRRPRNHAVIWAALVIVLMLLNGNRYVGWIQAWPAIYILGRSFYEATA